MRARFSLIVAAMILLAGSVAAKPNLMAISDPLYMWGIDLSLACALHAAFTPTPFGDSPAPVFGGGLGFAAGLYLQWRLDISARGPALIMHAGYESLPASFESAATSNNGVGSHGEEMPVNGRHVADVGYGLIRADLQIRLPLLRLRYVRLNLQVGPSVGYVVRTKWEQTFAADGGGMLRRDAGYPVDAAGTSVTLEEGTIRDAAQWRVGACCGISWWIENHGLIYIPSISFDYGITPVVKGSSWRGHALQLGLTVVPTKGFWKSIFGGDESNPL